MKKLFSLALAGLGILVLAAACSDDTFIATNEIGDEDSGSGGSSGSGASGGQSSGGDAGMAGLAGAAGDPGSGGSAGSSGGSGGSAGSGGGSGGSGGGTQCTPGTKENLGACAMCGTSERTCQSDGTWGAPQCTGQGACEPGQTSTSGCTDGCDEKTCTSSCTWSACKLKAGAKCLYKAGTSFQCCGAGKWQFCSKTTCDWFPCAACSGCGC